MRLLVTRPQPQADAWVARLREAGFDAVALPLIEVAAAPDVLAVEAAWHSLRGRALVVFVSPSAAECFVAARPAGSEWPPSLAAAAVGPGTARALREAGVAHVVEPAADSTQFDSEALWQQLARRDWRSAAVLIVRGDGGRDWLTARLQDAGATVDALAAYTRRPPRWHGDAAAALHAALSAPADHRWLFSSSQAIDHLAAASAGTDWRRAHALATHPRIAARARSIGIADVIEARASFDAVVSALRA